ncbi:DsbA family oxidoreductase [Pseudochryseolinea flava]|uniref:Disulfide bond formation protein DsbA n=1 Tax=Pseudochryseolinea flava TaxID=2059302 RepID=A0A364Y053_9BACT|nr:DsbA family oxidoreductase [Pseudochryseolinea flava]RAW00162.1 disulfide bond formation protein DsbA [Pseudochryseolinea flava]
MNTKPTIKIDIVSDIVCPWCYIGKRRLEKAMHQLADKFQFEVEYHPFELNPNTPVEGVNQKEHLIDKFGSEARYEQLTGNVTNVAAQEGLTFDYDKQTTSPNTRMLHSIVQLAKLEGKHLEVMEALFNAYFTDGVDLTNKNTLREIAKSVGLVNAADPDIFASPQAIQQISLAEKELSKLGITGVPFYIINNKYGVSGAQASETFVKAFQEIHAESEVAITGDACDVDGKNC